MSSTEPLMLIRAADRNPHVPRRLTACGYFVFQFFFIIVYLFGRKPKKGLASVGTL
jgi:hypothetical protein